MTDPDVVYEQGLERARANKKVRMVETKERALQSLKEAVAKFVGDKNADGIVYKGPDTLLDDLNQMDSTYKLVYPKYPQYFIEFEQKDTPVASCSTETLHTDRLYALVQQRKHEKYLAKQEELQEIETAFIRDAQTKYDGMGRIGGYSFKLNDEATIRKLVEEKHSVSGVEYKFTTHFSGNYVRIDLVKK